MFSAKDIKNLRRALNLNQRELADKLGVSVRTVANYEKGGVIPESKHKILVNLTKHDPIAEKILGVITGDSSIRGNNNISNPSNLLVGDSNKNVQLGHGSKIMHGNEADQEVMSSLQARIIELETELIKKNGEIAVKDETIKGKDKEIKGLQEQLILKTEMITLLQNHNKK